MAVAMEVAWRGVELGSSPVLDMSKKRAWGADTEKLMQLMMGQFQTSATTGVLKPAEVTLDLLGTAAGSLPSGRSSELDCNSSPEFLELDPDHPIPSGWEKCLDLKTGELYFVNKSTGVRTSEDPRKQQNQQQKQKQQMMTSKVLPTPSPLAHEFLGSKKSETMREESLRTSTSSGSSGAGSPRGGSSKPAAAQLLSFSTGKQLWNLQLDDRSTVSLNRTGSPRFPSCSDEEESNLELNLNLSAGGGSPSQQQQQQLQQQQSVCTMEMVQQALRRTEKAMGKREMPSSSFGPKHSGSSSFSSLTSARSEPSWSHASPSTSSSSSTSSRSAARGTSTSHHDDSHTFKSSPSGVCEAESRKVDTVTSALVMGACTRCLMYVMLNKSDPKCPRCESEVPLDFSSPPKRQRVEPNAIQT